MARQVGHYFLLVLATRHSCSARAAAFWDHLRGVPPCERIELCCGSTQNRRAESAAGAYYLRRILVLIDRFIGIVGWIGQHLCSEAGDTAVVAGGAGVGQKYAACVVLGAPLEAGAARAGTEVVVELGHGRNPGLERLLWARHFVGAAVFSGVVAVDRA